MAEIASICVFCGSRVGVSPVFRVTAQRLGTALGVAGIRLVYGGGRIGLMGVLADAVLAAGGRVAGVIPFFLERREVGHGGLDELVVVGSMHERKQRMFDLADAFVVLPGGIGTLDEAIEILTWKQLGRHDKPVVLLDVAGAWAPLLILIEHVIANGFAEPSLRGLLTVVHAAEDVLPAILQTPATKPGSSAGL